MNKMTEPVDEIDEWVNDISGDIDRLDRQKEKSFMNTQQPTQSAGKAAFLGVMTAAALMQS